MYARKGGEDVQSTAANLGGEKISVDDACVRLNYELCIIWLQLCYALFHSKTLYHYQSAKGT